MITTFDNKQWDKEEILSNMYDDNFYYGYLGQNALSSSSIKTLLSSPKTYYFTTKYGSGETQALRDGKLFHTMILEPEKLNDIIFVDAATKASKEYKLAKETGKEVYTNSEKKAAEHYQALQLQQTGVSSSFDDDAELDFYIENQPILTKEEEQEQMDRINKGCDLIRKMGLSANIPEPY